MDIEQIVLYVINDILSMHLTVKFNGGDNKIIFFQNRLLSYIIIINNYSNNSNTNYIEFLPKELIKKEVH